MAGHKVVMRCVTPIMSASGEQLFKPGDLLPEGDPAVDDSPHSWALHIVADEEPEPEPKPVPSAPAVSPVVEDPKPAVEF